MCRACGTHGAQHAKLARALENRGVQGIGNAQQGHDNRNHLQGVGDRKGLFDQFQHAFFKLPAGQHVQRIASGKMALDPLGYPLRLRFCRV